MRLFKHRKRARETSLTLLVFRVGVVESTHFNIGEKRNDKHCLILARQEDSYRAKFDAFRLVGACLRVSRSPWYGKAGPAFIISMHLCINIAYDDKTLKVILMNAFELDSSA